VVFLQQAQLVFLEALLEALLVWLLVGRLLELLVLLELQLLPLELLLE
jgi:hypothetical protein